VSLTTSAWPDRLLDLRDWESLPPDESHQIECVEGVLVVTPKPLPRHQQTMVRLWTALDRTLPEYVVLVDVEILLERAPLTVRAPDVVVVESAAASTNPPRLDGAAARLVVEVLSEGSRRTDRVTKMSEYAEAGIGEYWIVDLAGAATLSIYTLNDLGQYDRRGEYTGIVGVTACGRPIELDLEAISRI
jgi:Uma2 family endonuclease